MAKKNLRGINFPGLPDAIYMAPEYNDVQDDATDLSVLIEPGRYRYTSSTVNLPDGLSSGFVDVVVQSSSFVWQIFHDTSAGIAYRSLTTLTNGIIMANRMFKVPGHEIPVREIAFSDLDGTLTNVLSQYPAKLVSGYTVALAFTDEIPQLGMSGVRAMVTAFCKTEGYGYALLRFYHYNTGVLTARMNCYNGTWSDIMWENPPMEIGVEYCTTEMWNGKRVYTKLINFGAMPAATMKGVAHNLGATQIVRYWAQVSDGTALPYNDGTVTVNSSCNITSAVIVSNIDQSATHTAKFQVWYTK